MKKERKNLTHIDFNTRGWEVAMVRGSIFKVLSYGVDILNSNFTCSLSQSIQFDFSSVQFPFICFFFFFSVMFLFFHCKTMSEWKLLSHVWLFMTLWIIKSTVFQARILQWVAFPFSKGSSQPGDRTQVSHIAGRFFTSWTIRVFFTAKLK